MKVGARAAAIMFSPVLTGIPAFIALKTPRRRCTPRENNAQEGGSGARRGLVVVRMAKRLARVSEVSYTFRTNPFGLQIQEPPDNSAQLSWRIVGVSNSELKSSLVPGRTTLVSINGRRPPSRFDQLALLLTNAQLPLKMTFLVTHLPSAEADGGIPVQTSPDTRVLAIRRDGEQKVPDGRNGRDELHVLDSSSDEWDPNGHGAAAAAAEAPTTTSSAPHTRARSRSGPTLPLKSKRERFFNAMRLRDHRREGEHFIRAKSTPHTTPTATSSASSPTARPRSPVSPPPGGASRHWEYEDVIEIMRLGGVHRAMRELENTYRRRSLEGKEDGGRGSPRGWRGRVATLFGTMGVFGGNGRRSSMLARGGSDRHLRMDGAARGRAAAAPTRSVEPVERPSPLVSRDQKLGRNVTHHRMTESSPAVPKRNTLLRRKPRRHHRTVTFCDAVGRPLIIGPRRPVPSSGRVSHRDGSSVDGDDGRMNSGGGDAKSASETHSILKHTRRESFDQFFQRVFQERRRKKKVLLEHLKRGATMLKFDTSGRASPRWFCVSSDGSELYYSKRKPKAMIRKHEKDRLHDSISLLRQQAVSTATSSTASSPYPSVREGALPGRAAATETIDDVEEDKEHDKILHKRGILKNLFINPMKRFFTADIVELYLGPWYSGVRSKQIVPWRFMTLKFPDRLLNLQCSDEQQMDVWFLGLQALAPTAPLNPLYLTKGRFLWKRLIMKMEHYGIEALKELIP